MKSHILHTISAPKKQPRAVRKWVFKRGKRYLLKALFTLTNDCLTGFKELTDKDLLSLKLMDNIRQPIEEALDAGGLSTKEMFRSIMILLDAITRYGTPQFTRQARLAFMARAFCRTLVFAGYFTDEEMDNFTKSINTISSEFDNDFERYSVGKMSMEDFNKKYGHLRSGTYDIRTDRYDKMNFRPVSNRRKDQLKIMV